MKNFVVVSAIALMISLTGSLSGQNNGSEDRLDTRIDNLGYWKAAAERGLTAPNPMISVAPATFTGDEIRAISVISENSPDVPTATGATSQSENSIVVDPNNTETILNSNNSTNTPSGGITLYGADDLYSFDGGTTWEGEIAGAGGSNQGDPVALIGNDGRWFVGYIRNNGQWVSYSDNQGDSWTALKVADAPSGYSNLLDKNHMWIDRSTSSPYEGYLYDAWTTFGGQNNNDIEISVSSTNGESWAPGINVSNSLNAGSHCQGVNITTGPDGEAYALFAIYDNWPSDEDALALARSFDGGQTWESFRIIDNIRGIRNSATGKNMRVNSFPCIVADISTGPNRGNLYAVWTNIGVPGTNTGNDIDVYMIRSEDEGTTWSDPIRVNQDPSGLGKQHFFPWIDCDPVSGTLSVVFYDDRNVTSAQCEVYCANSYDGGDTWEDFKVSDVSFTPSPIPGLASGYFGDYIGIRAYGGKVYPVWTDNRTGTALTYVSPYTTSTMVAPTSLQATLDEEDGSVTLSWQHPLGPTFDHFNIYRNLQLLGTSTWPTFADTLPNYGHYRYIVTAYYSIEGESGGAIADVQWGNAQAGIDPASVEETLMPEATSVRYLDISNTGELPLEYDLTFTLPPAISDSERDYCTGTGGCGEYIRRVEIGDIDNYSECSEYEDYTELSTTLAGGMQYTLRIENGLSSYPTDLCGVWIDWNQNGSFTDDTPVTLQGSPGIGPYTATLTVPETAFNGPTTMRVRIIRTGVLSPCGQTQYGEVEDYSLNVINWISADPTSGEADPGETDQVALQFRAGNLPLGDYHIDLNITSNDPDNGTITVPITMNIQDISLAVAAEKDSICLGTSTRLYATVSGGSGNPSFLWSSDPAGFTSTEQNPMVTPGATTVYHVQVTDGAIILNDHITITAFTLPVVDLGEDIAVCPGNTATLDAGPGFASYFWCNGSTGQTLTVAEPGGYWVEVANDFGCADSDTVYFSIHPSAVVTLGEDASFCENSTYTISAGPGYASYIWSSGETTEDITVGQAGAYWVAVTDANGCPASDTIILAVDPLPASTTILSGPSSVDNFQVTASDFTADAAAFATSYAWSLEPAGAGTISGTTTSAQVSWNEGFTGTALVSVVPVNECGNGASSPGFSILVFSSQGVEERTDITGISIYPNPSDGRFNLTMSVRSDKEIFFKINTANGNTIMQEKEVVRPGNFSKVFDLSGLPKGNYRIVVVSAESGNVIEALTAILK